MQGEHGLPGVEGDEGPVGPSGPPGATGVPGADGATVRVNAPLLPIHHSVYHRDIKGAKVNLELQELEDCRYVSWNGVSGM